MSQYTTGELAKECGITVRTVQFYDQKGILVPSALTEGGRPPFMAAPDLERQYRGFLKQASKYAEIFDKGLEEEFYVPTRFDMNNAALASRAAYNDFVKAANQLR